MYRNPPTMRWPLILSCAILLPGLASAAQNVGGRWNETYRLDGQVSNQGFGYRVDRAGDIDGDGREDLLIGEAWADTANGAGSGRFTIRSGADGSLIREILGLAAGEGLGARVSGGRDWDGDGIPDHAVTASDSSAGGVSTTGAVFVYSGADGSLLNSFFGSNPYDGFGGALAFVGDLDGDGKEDLAIGAPGHDEPGAADVGAIFLYYGPDGSRSDIIPGSDAGERLGDACAGPGDIDGDGMDDLLIGASSAAANGWFQGGYVQLLSGVDRSELWRLEGWHWDMRLGWGMDEVGDVDGGGTPDLLFTAYGADVNGAHAVGSVFVYAGEDFRQVYRMDAESSYDNLGYSVAGAGDVNGDLVPDFLAGAPRFDPGGRSEAGRGFVYSGRDGSTLLVVDGPIVGDNLGWEVAGLGDVSGDGLPDVAVASMLADSTNAVDSGSVWVFDFDPFLRADGATLSASGDARILELAFPSERAYFFYRILVSLEGIGPSTYDGLEVPLTQDSVFGTSASGNTPDFALGFTGVLSENGKSSAALAPPVLSPSLIGRELFLAAVVAPFFGSPVQSSAAVALQIVP